MIFGKLVERAFTFGIIDQRLVETLLILIPKVENPSHLRNFRPISLCNVVYKIITKVHCELGETFPG